MGSDMIFAGSFLWSLINNLNINIVISMSCVVYRVWPSHHRNINRRQRTSFFVPEIQYPQGLPRFFTQPKST